MCLIAIAHRASARFPLVIAANRDEDYARPSLPLQVWSDAPEVAGGRDALHGGSWLAVSRAGRFAAVTNLRGARTTTRSRGALVRDYVVSNALPSDYSEFAGFHLLAGTIGGDLQYITPHVQTLLEDGIHAFSNAPEGERWPKMDLAATQLQTVLSIEDPRALSDELLWRAPIPYGCRSSHTDHAAPAPTPTASTCSACEAAPRAPPRNSEEPEELRGTAIRSPCRPAPRDRRWSAGCGRRARRCRNGRCPRPAVSPNGSRPCR
jgi:hypothetical protein